MAESAPRVSKAQMARMNPIDFLRTVGSSYTKLLVYLKPYKVRFGFALFFGIIYGAVQGLMVFTMKHVGTAVFPEGATDKGGTGTTALLLCLAIPGIMTVRGVCSYLNSYLMLWVSVHVLNDIRNQVFDRLMAQSMSFFNSSKTGELIGVVFARTRMAQNALTTVASEIVKQPIAIVSAIVALFYIDWRFTLASLILFPICLLPVNIIARTVKKSGEQEEVDAAGMMVLMNEAFAGIRVVKSHAREDYERKRFSVASRRSLKNQMRWKAAMEMVNPLVEIIASFGVSGALLYAWYFDLGAGKFIALNGGLLLLYAPFKSLSRLHLLMMKCVAATSRVFDIIEMKPEIEDSPDARELANCRGDIRFEDVSFKYVNSRGKAAKKAALKNFTIEIPSGTKTALVGSSGAGKSTVMALLLRLYETREGRILIDGNDIRDLTQNSLRNQIGIVSQDTFLFHDTIRKNIRYGRLDATDEEIEAAAKLAHAHDFIVKTVDGYESIVGDKGCMLSGGQQQRLAIARALLKNAPILLLDEATSALDSESEKQIQAALENLSVGRTVIAIAHRLSTILNADQIVVMHKGQISAAGTHAELYETSAVYRKLYDLQFHLNPGAAEGEEGSGEKADEKLDERVEEEIAASREDYL